MAGNPFRRSPRPSFAEAVSDACPSFLDEVGAVTAAQGADLHHLVANEHATRAARLIASLAVTDLNDLHHDIERGSGRSAMRSARSLIEHAINMHTVLASPDDSERYMAHLSLGPILAGSSEFSLLGLDKKRRRKARRAAERRAREVRPAWNAAIEAYGKRFTREWHPARLVDRASEHDLDHLYDAFRIASNVAHGSAAGSIGHFYKSDSNQASYFAGHIPDLVPLAWLMGADAYLQLIAALEASDHRISLETARVAVQHLIEQHYIPIWDLVQAHRAALDESVRSGQSRVTLILAVSRGGRRRWYLYSPDMAGEVWLRAKETPDAVELANDLQGLVDAYVESQGEFSEGGWFAIEIPMLGLPVDLDRASIPADAIFPRLVPNDDMSVFYIAVERLPDDNLVIEGEIGLDPGVELHLDPLAFESATGVPEHGPGRRCDASGET